MDFEDNDADIFNLDGVDPELSFDDRTSIESLTSDTNDSQSDQEGSESVANLKSSRHRNWNCGTSRQVRGAGQGLSARIQVMKFLTQNVSLMLGIEKVCAN